MLQNIIFRRLQYNRQTWQFFVTIAALGFTIDGVYAVLLNLYLLRLDYDTTFIGQVNAIGLITFALMSLPAGIMGARWTSRQMLRVGMGVILLATTLLPLVEYTPAAWHEIWLIVSYALMLIGFSLYFVNGAPFLVAAVGDGKQSSAFAMHSALLSLAAFIGSLLGGSLPEIIARYTSYSLDDPQPYRFTLMIVAVVVFVAFFVVMTIKEAVLEPETEKVGDNLFPPVNSTSYTKAAIILIIVMSVIRFLQVSGIGTAATFFNVYMDTTLDVSPGAIGIIAAIGRLIAVPAALIAPRLIRRWGNGAIATWASFATAAFLLPLAFSTGWLLAAVGYIGAIATSSLRFTAFIVYLMEIVPKRQQAVIAGAGEMAAGFSFASMALGGGYIVAVLTFRDLFLLGSILTFLGTGMFWLHLRYGKKK